MKCKKCGASLSDTDKFCDQCGWKVVKHRRCPECGAVLREGTKFCPKCGVLVGSGKSNEGKTPVRDAEASDIPIGDIEQNILSETERELHTGKKKRPAAAEPKKSVPAPEPKKKKKPEPVKKRVYEEWDDEDEDDEDDDDDAGSNFMVIMTAAMAFLIIVLAVPTFFIAKGKWPVKNYDDSVEEEQDNGADDVENENDGEAEPEENNTIEAGEPDSEQPVGTLSIVSNVNVRDNPSTQANIIKVAKAGETYEYMGMSEDGSWYVIVLEDDSIGFVFEQYVSVD